MRKLQDLLDVVKERGISKLEGYVETTEGQPRFSVIGHLLVLLGMNTSELMELSGTVSRMMTNPGNRSEIKAVLLLVEAGYSMLDLRQLERSQKKGIHEVMADIYALADDLMNISLVSTREYGSLVRKMAKYRRNGIPAEQMIHFYVGRFPIKVILDSTGRSEDDLRSDVDFVLSCSNSVPCDQQAS
ncbi:hypothetical protein ACFQI7_28190 [Paenibacillus allorhizosphaerae]|uniref:Uncharacterized protein n=1 Tax=Paenibacillus allorhizosphaerae TaxID=2849866 RepID=A0ABM8VNK9_9BACL|nr:hypothetical protein [Paenibacillus allorhizosphaerae]CAG7651465.1 hypothetical protein PAECIP111802_04971 [Paenibacillus allorhizosphaerae]